MENDKVEEEKRKIVEEVSDEEEMLLLDGEMEVEEKGTHEIPLKASMNMFWKNRQRGPIRCHLMTRQAQTRPKQVPKRRHRR